MKPHVLRWLVVGIAVPASSIGVAMSKVIEQPMLRLRDRLVPSVPNYLEANRNGLAAATAAAPAPAPAPGRKYLILGL